MPEGSPGWLTFQWLNNSWIQLLFISAAAFAAYSNTFQVPFYFDDQTSIVENKAVHSLRNLGAIWDFSPMRFVSYLSFALNYHLHGLEVRGYHAFNIFIHLIAGFSLWGLFRGLSRSPALRREEESFFSRLLPLAAALLFILHPLQTQAITYIVQRSAALAGLFYIGVLAAYVQARLANVPAKRMLWYGAMTILAVLALFTKQNAITLPLAVLAVEAVFFSASRRKILGITALLLAGAAGGYALLTFGFGQAPFALKALDAATRETREISRIDYLATQTMVLWKYLQLYIFPVNLHLDYDFPVASGFGSLKVAAAVVGHTAFLGAAFFGRRRFPLLAFAVLLFYVSHLVESSLIPIRDVLFEHRMYLPVAALSIGLAGLAGLAARRRTPRIVVAAGLALLLMSWGVMAYSRNEVWLDPIIFWQDNVAKAPGKARPYNNLGRLYAAGGENQKAVELYRKALEVDPDYVIAYNNIGNILNRMERPGPALEYLQRGLKLDQFWEELHFNAGRALDLLGRNEEAIRHYEMAVHMAPEHTDARNNLANLLYRSGRGEEAIPHYYKAIEAAPGNILPYYNLAAIFYMKGDHQQAAALLARALSMSADDADFHILMARVQAAQGRDEEAVSHYQKALSLSPGARAEISYGLAALYGSRGMAAEAVRWLADAVASGFDDWQRIAADSNFDKIRDEPGYRRILQGKRP